MSSYHTDSGGQTTTTTTTQITPLIWFDREYIHSNTGLLNLVVIVSLQTIQCLSICILIVYFHYILDS